MEIGFFSLYKCNCILNTTNELIFCEIASATLRHTLNIALLSVFKTYDIPTPAFNKTPIML